MFKMSREEDHARPKVSVAAIVRGQTFIVIALFVASRIIFALAGVRMTFNGLPGDWQLLDLHQLRKNFVTAIFNLHSQPPLFNSFTGFLLRFPSSIQHDVATVSSLLLGLTIVICVFHLLKEFNIPFRIALAITVLVMTSPSFILYENCYFYTYTTTAALTFCALALVKFLRLHSLGWGAAYCFGLAVVIFANSTFQWPWMVLGLVPVFATVRLNPLAIAKVALIPIILVFGWYAKDAIKFHTFSTSSWIGMNMTHVTIDSASPKTLRQMIAKKQLTPIAAIPAFSPVDFYVPNFIPPHQHADARVLNSKTEDGIYQNFDNINFIAISNAYLKDDLKFILLRPVSYLSNVTKAAQIFVVPADQYEWLRTNAAKITTYISWYDKVLMLQPSHMDPATYTAQSGYTSGGTGVRTSWSQESYLEIVILFLTLFVLPYLLIRRRFERVLAWTLGFIFISTAYTFLATNLFELGENNRFQMDLGPLPLIAAIAVGVNLYGARSKRRPTTDPKSAS